MSWHVQNVPLVLIRLARPRKAFSSKLARGGLGDVFVETSGGQPDDFVETNRGGVFVETSLRGGRGVIFVETKEVGGGLRT